MKAFNTNFAGGLGTGRTGSAPVTVLVAGDDAAARQQLVDLVEAARLAALPAGSLKRARELEAIGFLQITLAAQQLIGWDGGFSVQK